MTKNKNISIFAAILVGIIGFFVFSQNTAITPSPDQLQKTLNTQESNADQEPESMDSYIPYSKAAFASAKDKKRVLFFYATWCPTCKPVNEEFLQKTSEIPSGVVIFKVNYSDPDTDSEEKLLAKKYQVTYQHTFVQVDENDQVVVSWNGGGLEDLKTKLSQ